VSVGLLSWYDTLQQHSITRKITFRITSPSLPAHLEKNIFSISTVPVTGRRVGVDRREQRSNCVCSVKGKKGANLVGLLIYSKEGMKEKNGPQLQAIGGPPIKLALLLTL
jgi:hypothetical protein